MPETGSHPTASSARQSVSTNVNVSALRGLSASSFAVLRQGKVRLGNSCLDVTACVDNRALQSWFRSRVSLETPLKYGPDLQFGYHAARTRRVSAAGLAPPSGQVVTQIQSGSPRTDSPVRILLYRGGLVSSAFRLLRRSYVRYHPQSPRFSSGSALGPSHDGIRRMRRTNLQRRPCRKTYGRHQDSKRTRLIHRPYGDIAPPVGGIHVFSCWFLL